MKLRTQQSIENQDYVFIFEIDASSISSDDADRIKKFGAPSINFGGDFDDGNGLTFTLPDQYAKLPSEFPVRQIFSLTAPFDTNGLEKFELYRTTVEERISNAIINMRNAADTFTGEYIVNI